VVARHSEEAGFSIERESSRFGIVYREGDWKIDIPSFELLSGRGAQAGIRIADLDHWDTPNGPLSLDAEDRTRVMKNIERHFKKMRIIWD